MRRDTQVKTRAFGNGLVLAALPVVAFVGVDYLLAPPSDARSEPNPVAAMIGTLGRTISDTGSRLIFSASDTAHASSVPFADSAESNEADAGFDGARSAKGKLVASIQTELMRVGCYTGATDGRWNDRTRSAMQAFNSSVRVNIDIENPDYILLTLVQGHNAKACAPACAGEHARAGGCKGRSADARAIAPALRSEPVRSAASVTTPWTTTTVASNRIYAEASSSSPPIDTANLPSAAPVRKVLASMVATSTTGDLRAIGRFRTFSTAALAEPPKLFPGERMAVGAPLPPPGTAIVRDREPVTMSPSLTPSTPIRPTGSAPRADRPTFVVRRASQPPKRTTRLRRTFTELGHAAP
jgi:hypothetical protein